MLPFIKYFIVEYKLNENFVRKLLARFVLYFHSKTAIYYIQCVRVRSSSRLAWSLTRYIFGVSVLLCCGYFDLMDNNNNKNANHAIHSVSVPIFITFFSHGNKTLYHTSSCDANYKS